MSFRGDVFDLQIVVLGYILKGFRIDFTNFLWDLKKIMKFGRMFD